MGALGYFLERAGIATTGISLVRENTVSLRAPRALWVPFPLGRPLGAAGHAPFQRRVIDAALELLNADAGPVLVDFPEDAPDSPGGPPFCSVPLNVAVGDPVDEVRMEYGLILPWYERAVARRGRTTVGLSTLGDQQRWHRLREALRRLPTGAAEVREISLVLEDLKAVYLEAASAMPSATANAASTAGWMYRSTRLGAFLETLQRAYANHPEPALRSIARGLAPRGAFKEES